MEEILYINDMNLEVKNGGAVFEKRILDVLSIDHEVKCANLYALGRNSFQKIKDVFFSPIPTLFSRNQTKNLKKLIKDSQAKIVFLACSKMGYLAKYTKKKGKKVICFFQNCEVSLFKYSRGKIFVPFIKKQEKLTLKFSDYCFFLNERDYEDIKKNYNVNLGEGRYSFAPISLEDKLTDADIEKMKSKPKGNKGLFLGSYFPPNYHGVEWFAKNVGNKIDATIDVVGYKFEEYSSYLSDNMNLIGTVDNVSDFIINADFIISPIFEGSGMKVKTCEALMYGKKIFATKEALEGYKELDGAFVRCDTPEEFIRSINEFIHSDDYAYNPVARRLFVENYSEESFKKLLNSVVKIFLD